MPPHNIHALHQRPVLIRDYLQHLAALPFVAAGDHDDMIALLNLELRRLITAPQVQGK